MDEDPNPPPIMINGRPIDYPGDLPLSVLLYLKGYWIFRRSLRYRRPRGLRNLDWWGSERVYIEGLGDVNPNIFTPGEPVNVIIPEAVGILDRLVWLNRYLFRVNALHGSILRNKYFWRIFTKYMDRLLPYGAPPIETETPEKYPVPGYIDADVIVIGGGLAGLSAAIETSKGGLNTCIIEAGGSIGGYASILRGLEVEGIGRVGKTLDRLIHIARRNGVKIITNTVFQGWLEDSILGYRWDTEQSTIISGRYFIIATGGYEVYPVFENNDLPGVMSLKTLLRLIFEYGYRFDNRVIILGVNGDTPNIVRLLSERGFRVTIIDNRARSDIDKSILEGIEDLVDQLYLDVEYLSAMGSSRVKGLRLRFSDGEEIYINTWVVAYSQYIIPDGEVSRQLGLRYVFDSRLGGYIPLHNLRGETPIKNIYLSGLCSGYIPIELSIIQGRLTGLMIVNNAIGRGDGGDELYKELRDTLARKYHRIYGGYMDLEDSYKGDRVYSFIEWRDLGIFYNGDPSKMFICLDMDVTYRDIDEATTSHGFWRIEHLKRYTGLGTGACQGRICQFLGALSVTRVTGRDPLEVGLFRARYPVIPQTLYSLAGVY